jgi:hypothetical protein
MKAGEEVLICCLEQRWFIDKHNIYPAVHHDRGKRGIDLAYLGVSLSGLSFNLESCVFVLIAMVECFLACSTALHKLALICSDDGFNGS